PVFSTMLRSIEASISCGELGTGPRLGHQPQAVRTAAAADAASSLPTATLPAVVGVEPVVGDVGAAAATGAVAVVGASSQTVPAGAVTWSVNLPPVLSHDTRSGPCGVGTTPRA